MRSDAARNHARLLDAARHAFDAHGIDAPLTDVAREAGVGIGTLYRHFATREVLIEALFEKKWVEYRDAAVAALDVPDPWEAFRGYIERICHMQAEDRGFTDVLTTRFASSPTIEKRRDEARDAAARVLRRAQDHGSVRADVVVEDIPFILIANGAYLETTRDVVPHAWKRYIALLLDAMRTDGGRVPLPPAPTAQQVRRAMTPGRDR